MLPQRRHDAFQGLEQPDRFVEVHWPQQRQERMIAAEEVQGPIAMFVVVAVEEAAELMAMQLEVGGVPIQNDACWQHGMLLHESLHQKLLHGVEVSDNLFITAVGFGADRSEFEAVEGAFARQRFALIAAQTLVAKRIFLADQDGEERIVAELIVVIVIFVAQAQAENALLEKFVEGVLDAFGITVIGETASELGHEAELGFDFAQEQAAGIGGDFASEGGNDFTFTQSLEIKKG
jgi:hypothetical protein